MRRVTILVDALSALQGGGQTYLRNLFEHLDKTLGLRVVALVPAEHWEVFRGNPEIELVVPSFPTRNVFLRLAWYLLNLRRVIRDTNADVLFCPGGMIPPLLDAGCRTAVAFQNMLPFSLEERARYPLGFMRGRLWLLQLLQAASFRRADLTVFISYYAKTMIDVFVRKRQGRSVVIPHGLAREFREKRPRVGVTRFPDGYVLYVSILTVYKAQLEVIRAWKMLKAVRPTREKLVLAGPRFSPYARKVRALIDELGLEGEVVIAGNLPYTELPAWYQHARINLFASSCENCPNILLEAMAAGRPILCSDYQPMPEFARQSVEYFDPYAPAELAALLGRYLDDPGLCERMGEAALQESMHYQWDEAAGKTWRALQELALPPERG